MYVQKRALEQFKHISSIISCLSCNFHSFIAVLADYKDMICFHFSCKKNSTFFFKCSLKLHLSHIKKCHCSKKKKYFNESASTLFKQKKSQKNSFFKVLNDKTCVFVEQVSMLVSCIS